MRAAPLSGFRVINGCRSPSPPRRRSAVGHRLFLSGSPARVELELISTGSPWRDTATTSSTPQRARTE
jgi:hypothetical protein